MVIFSFPVTVLNRTGILVYFCPEPQPILRNLFYIFYCQFSTKYTHLYKIVFLFAQKQSYLSARIHQILLIHDYLRTYNNLS